MYLLCGFGVTTSLIKNGGTKKNQIMTILQDLKLQFKIGGIVQKIIFWNVGLYILSLLLNLIFQFSKIEMDCLDLVSLSSKPENLLWHPWTIISYAFFHAGFTHILFNMLILNFSGRLFLTLFSERQFVGLYFVGAVFAGIIFIVCYFLFPSLRIFDSKLVGASGAIMAILVGIATQAPLMEVRLLLIGNVKLWHIAFVTIILDLVQLPLENTGGHLAHLGGALFGFLYVKQVQKGVDIAAWFNSIVDFFVNLTKKKSEHQFKKVYKNHQNVSKTILDSTPRNKSQQQVDDILDKISKSGYDSLTADEKEFLFKFGT